MNKLITKLTEASKVVVAISSAIGVIISLLGWISIQIYSFSSSFKKAIELIPVVEQNSLDIKEIKKNYMSYSDHRVDISEIQQKYIITEIDALINIATYKLSINDNSVVPIVNRLVFYRDNLSFLTNQQINNINYIEKKADRLH